MSKEAKIVSIAALVFLAFFAYGKWQTEYSRITSRVETTQAKVDALADELQATTATIHAAIKSLTDRFLAIEAGSVDNDISTKTQVAIDGSNQKQVIRSTDVNSLSKRTSSVPTIIMHSGYSCGPCNAWISRDMPRWKQSGWNVEVIKELDSNRAWPWYEITDRDGSQFEVDGPLNRDNFNAAKLGK